MKTLDKILLSNFRQSDCAVGIFRILFASSIIIAGSGIPYYGDFSQVPREILVPPLGCASFLLPGINRIGPQVMGALAALIKALPFLLLVGYRSRLICLCLFVLHLVTRCWAYSLGKIDHDIAFVASLFCLSFANLDSDPRLSISPQNRTTPVDSIRESWPFGLLAILLAFGMWTAGLQKTVGGWLATDGHASVGWIIYMKEAWHRTPPIEPFLGMILNSPSWVLESLDWAPVVLELLFPLALLKRRYFQLFCGVAILFHFGTFLFYGIYFHTQIAVYFAFVRWDQVGLALVKFLRWPLKCYWTMPDRARRAANFVAVVGSVTLLFYSRSAKIFMIVNVMVTLLWLITVCLSVLRSLTPFKERLADIRPV